MNFMNFEQYFSPYTDKINRFLENFLQEKIKEAQRINPSLSLFWKNIRNFALGGKRVRGNLIRLGYECFKKADDKKLLPISAAIELNHSAILIHDDIIDQSKLRRNQSTIHEKYKEYHLKNYQKGIATHYGESMALDLGIIGYYEAIKLITHSLFTDSLKIKIINELSSSNIKAGYGEGLDIDLPYREKIKEKDIFDIYTYKTAYYTIVGPLNIGSILAGAKKKDLKIFRDYGLPLGIAFQIQDDILGIFGDERITGKEIGDDIRKGKNTILFTQVIKKADFKQKKRVRKLWGKENISLEEIKEVREIISQTGSLNYCQKLATNLGLKAKKAINKIESRELQEVFLSLADFIIKRKK